LAEKVTAGLAVCNGSLLPGGWLKVICGLIACTLDQLQAKCLVTSMGELYLFTILCNGKLYSMAHLVCLERVFFYILTPMHTL